LLRRPEFRPSDARLLHNDGRLAEFGIHKYESARLRLYTDIDADIAKKLPPVIDQAYDALVEYFGPLPPDREQTEYQMTGYIMADQDRFRAAGLLPADLPHFAHGSNRGSEFWMNEQPTDYYRRHLMIHEATHCFMTVLPDTQAPVWYMEGMAESFGTHYQNDEGQVRFRVMPFNKKDFVGLERIGLVRADVAAGRLRSLEEIAQFEPKQLADNETYAWSWALCWFFDSHPRYHTRFRLMGDYTTGTQFLAAVEAAFENELPRLRSEWAIFARDLELGYDMDRATIDFQAGVPLEQGDPSREFEIVADRGWQSSKIFLEQGRAYEVTATGRFQLGNMPKPWISEPQGVSITYADGHPLGMLFAAVHSRRGQDDKSRETMLDVIPVGRSLHLTPSVSGTLYLRINDRWSSLADNKGHVTVRVLAVANDIPPVNTANDRAR
jgi:hypothetical protein